MDVVTLRMPPEVVATLARMKVTTPRAASVVVEISGPRMVSTQIPIDAFSGSLSELAQSIRDWVFASAVTQSSMLTVASAEGTQYLSLTPNISTSTVLQALMKALPDRAIIDIR